MGVHIPPSVGRGRDESLRDSPDGHRIHPSSLTWDRYLQWPLFPSRSPLALGSTLSGNVRLPQLCYEERQETILSTVSLNVKWKRMYPSPKWAMKLRGSFSKNSCSRAVVLRDFGSSTPLQWLWE